MTCVFYLVCARFLVSYVLGFLCRFGLFPLLALLTHVSLHCNDDSVVVSNILCRSLRSKLEMLDFLLFLGFLVPHTSLLSYGGLVTWSFGDIFTW